MLPSPIVYGQIIDNTCILWQEVNKLLYKYKGPIISNSNFIYQECGETTNCLLYDTDKLREYLMFTTAGSIITPHQNYKKIIKPSFNRYYVDWGLI